MHTTEDKAAVSSRGKEHSNDRFPRSNNPAKANDIPKPSNQYFESLIRCEGIQQYEQALCDNHNFSSSPVSLESITRQYSTHTNPSASSSGPLERFSFISPAEDPHPTLARQELAAMNMSPGSLEHLKLRADTARTLAAGVPTTTKRRSSSVRAVASDASSTESSEVGEETRGDLVEPDDGEGEQAVEADFVLEFPRVGLERVWYGIREGGQRRVRKGRRMRIRDENMGQKRQRRS